MLRVALFFSTLCCCASCYSAFEPDVGALNDATACDGVDSDPEVDVSFENDIFPLFARDEGGCLDCHSEDGSDGSGLDDTGLDLSTYGRLSAGSEAFGSDLVREGDPCGSPLYLKLTPSATDPRMPRGGPYWTAEEQQLMHDWIVEGAENN